MSCPGLRGSRLIALVLALFSQAPPVVGDAGKRLRIVRGQAVGVAVRGWALTACESEHVATERQRLVSILTVGVGCFCDVVSGEPRCRGVVVGREHGHVARAASDGVRRAWGKNVGEREQWMRRAIADFVDENPGFANAPHDPMGETVNAAQFGFASDPANDMVAAHAFPSYRSWDRLATKLAHTSLLDDGSPDAELEHVYAGGMIGFKAAFAFREFLTRRREAEKTFDARQFINDAFTIGDDGEPVANTDALSEWPRIVGEDGADNRLAVAREAGRLAVDDVEETHVTAEELRNIMLLLPVLSGDEEVPGVGGRLDSSALASLGKSVSKVFTKAQKHAYEVTAGDAEGRVKRRMVVNALARALACPHISDAKNMKAASRAA